MKIPIVLMENISCSSGKIFHIIVTQDEVCSYSIIQEFKRVVSETASTLKIACLGKPRGLSRNSGADSGAGVKDGGRLLIILRRMPLV